MTVRLYNTLSRRIDELQPINDNTIKMYTCGLTVYSHPHIGNWLGYIYWDVLVRVLRVSGYAVERTQNITDVGHLTSDDDNGEDKMEKGARAEGITAWDVAQKYIDIADREAGELGLVPADHLVRATAMIDQQIEFAKILDDKGYLYRIAGDGMYFDTSKLEQYGQLARLDIDGLEAGARVSVEGKRNITDFAVWKFSPSDQKRDMEWDSPWGRGFPGWHLECSVIARETLGDQIDIHTGGIDHIPVHHTNEIAQTEAITGKQFASVWLHVNHIKVDGQKMSKSLGNIYTLDDITRRGYDLDAFKVFALSKHYRKEGNFTWSSMDAAAHRLTAWRNMAALRHQPKYLGDAWLTMRETPGYKHILFDEPFRFIYSQLKDDLNTVEPLMWLDQLTHSIVVMPSNEQFLHKFSLLLQAIDDLLGLNIAQKTPDISDDLKQIIMKRQTARANQDWQQSDELRHQLARQGITIRDTRWGQLWEYCQE